MQFSLHGSSGILDSEMLGACSFSCEKSENILTITAWNIPFSSAIPLIKLLEACLYKEGIRFLHISIPTLSLELSTLLTSQGYEGARTLKKQLSNCRTWRISLTEQCNYRCFFCHEEGMEMGKSRGSIDFDALFELIKEGVAAGFTDDITFTGGEPLLKRRELIALVQRMIREAVTPALTIGTNGVLINQELIDLLVQYPGKKKVNLSLHALDWETYAQIMCIRNRKNFERVHKNIDLLNKAAIPLKLNFVLLKGLNNHPAYLRKILHFAQEKQVQTVKFLELLVTEPLERFFPYYYETEAVKDIFGDELQLQRKSLDRNVYSLRGTPLQVELQACPCVQGCSACVYNTGRVFTAQLEYHPCFILTANKLRLDHHNAEEVFSRGEAQIAQFAARYGNGSPLIINPPRYVGAKRDYYYLPITVSNYPAFSTSLKQRGMQIEDRVAFKEIYYRPKLFSDQWREGRKVAKLVCSGQNEARWMEIVQTLVPHDGDHFSTHVTFLSQSGPSHTGSYEELAWYYESLEFEEWLRLSWDITVFSQNGEKINAAVNNETGRITVCSHTPLSNDRLRELGLTPLRMPLLNYMQEVLHGNAC